jgi:plastocyanin
MAPTSYAYSVPAPGYATPAPAPGTAYRTNPAPAPGNTYGANPAPNPDANPYGTAPAVPAPGGTYGDDSGNQPGSTAYGRGPGGGEQVPAGDVVTVRDHAYSPQTLNVRVGTTVHWKNQDDVAHSATGDGFDVEIPAGGEGSFTFSKAGTFDVKCRYHETMHGKVVVK